MEHTLGSRIKYPRDMCMSFNVILTVALEYSLTSPIYTGEKDERSKAPFPGLPASTESSRMSYRQLGLSLSWPAITFFWVPNYWGHL